MQRISRARVKRFRRRLKKRRKGLGLLNYHQKGGLDYRSRGARQTRGLEYRLRLLPEPGKVCGSRGLTAVAISSQRSEKVSSRALGMVKRFEKHRQEEETQIE